MNLFKSIVLFVLIFSSAFISIKAQALNDYRFAINPKGFMYDIWSEKGGQIAGVEINVINGKDIIYSLDYYKLEEWSILDLDLPNEFFYQVGLMSGKCYGNKNLRLQLQAGVSVFGGKLRTDKLISGGAGFLSSAVYDSKDFVTCGLVTKVGLKVIPLKYISVGFDLQTNFNSKRTVYMPMLSLEFGKLRQ